MSTKPDQEAEASALDFTSRDFQEYGILNTNVTCIFIGALQEENEQLKSMCIAFMRRNLNCDNCFQRMNFAIKYKCKELIQSVYCHILQFSDVLASNPAFLNMSLDQVKSLVLLENSTVNEDDSTEVLNPDLLTGIIKWIKHDPNERQGYLFNLIKDFKLITIDARLLRHAFWEDEFVRNNTDCRMLYLETIHNKHFTENQNEDESHTSFGTALKFEKKKIRKISSGGDNEVDQDEDSKNGIISDSQCAQILNDSIACESTRIRSVSLSPTSSEIRTRSSKRSFNKILNQNNSKIEGSAISNAASKKQLLASSKTRGRPSRNNNSSPSKPKTKDPKSRPRLTRGKGKNSCIRQRQTAASKSSSPSTANRRFRTMPLDDNQSEQVSNPVESMVIVCPYERKIAYFLCDQQRVLMSYNIETREPAKKVAIFPFKEVELGLIYHSGNIYFLGGCAEKLPRKAVKSVYKYNLRTKGWTVLPEMKEIRCHFQPTILKELIYAVAGCNGSEIINCVEKFDPVIRGSKMGTWKLADFPDNARADGGVATVNDKIYIIGGFFPRRRSILDSDSSPSDSGEEDGYSDIEVTKIVEAYDPLTDRWTARSPLPIPLLGPSVTVHETEQCIYVFGGSKKAGGERLKRAFVYHPEEDQWQELEQMHVGRRFASSIVLGGFIYVIGGNIGQVQTFEKYDIANDNWELIQECNLPLDGYYRSIAFAYDDYDN